MADTMLTVCSPSETWRVPLKPQGTVIGRNPTCDVVIDRADVSRRHAEISWAPSSHWTIKDLGSSNGTFVNGKRIDSCDLTADDVVQIGPVSLLLGEGHEHRPVVTPGLQCPKIIVEDFGTEVFYDRPRIEECTTQPCPGKLNQVRGRLSELTDLHAVYVEVCRALAQGSTTAAVIFRFPSADQPMPKIPEIVACHFGGTGEDTQAPSANRMDPFHRGLRVSHRLLEAVRANGRPLMTKSIFSCDTQVTISLIDEHSPRAILCTRIDSGQDAVDLLYVDVPIEDRVSPSPEEIFAFVQAVAQEAASVAGNQRRPGV
ncbi:MAG: FHA domain-containing protein [Sedimentisphaerales bacterium]|nr:FHA domain-containing protein [Sedimentisphaerales bacterium]